ncbi:MAG TPA: amino acid ABC transporter permease [Candidatus Sulfotelmatobacter sp.]|nr:amino acid ABC transporter permease [Candidatus Sulfotelmatobacter sp.]
MISRASRARAAGWAGACCVLPLAGCGGGYSWGWYIVSPGGARGRDNILFLLSGIAYTVATALCAIVISIVLGLLVALPGLSRNRVARRLNLLYVEALRAVPMLVMVLWVYYGLPVVLDIRLDPFFAGVVALALCDSAFEAEIFRAGIQSIERGQHEAADALGLGYVAKMRFVILPQAIRRVLPPLGNQFVYMLKTSSLVSVIGLTELTRRANELVVTEYRPLEVYTFLVLEYLALILIVSWAVRRLEMRLAAGERR